MKNQMKIILITAILAFFLVITTHSTAIAEDEQDLEEEPIIWEESDSSQLPVESRAASRFLLSKKKQPKSLKCNKNPRICRAKGSPGPYCCKKKCVDLKNDRLNCGLCGRKCKYSEACCGGKCVNLAFDKRHCGSCNNRCSKGDFCVYGLCNYAS